MSIRFFLDFISPYSYLAWTQIHQLAERHARSVEPIPILFAGLLDHFGHMGPAEIPPKRAYIFRNVLRLAAGLQVPLTTPAAHPFNPLLALRIASLPQLGSQQKQVIDALYRATWVERTTMSDSAEVASLLDGLGLDGAKLCRDASEPESKARVRSQTTEAIQLGVFGVPTILVDGELFWGLDSLPHVDQFLAGNDSIPAGVEQDWLQLAAGAHRRGQ